MINKTNYDIYASVEQKTFDNIVKEFIKENFGFMMGELAINQFVKELMKLYETYYPAKTNLKMGQMLWYAIDVNERPSYGKKISNTKLVPVVLTIFSQEDIKSFQEGKKLKDIRLNVIKRILNEAKQQGGVLSELDLKAIMKISSLTISKMITEYENQTNEILPRRGSLHDIGRTLTHKKIICYKKFVNNYSIKRIARETNHSITEVERYINDYKRVKYCLLKGFDNIQTISYILKLSKNLVKEYVELINELSTIKQEKEFENNISYSKFDYIFNEYFDNKNKNNLYFDLE